MAKIFFLSLYTLILSRDHPHLSPDKSFLSQNLSYHTATFILKNEGQSERIFSIIGLSEIVQYLSACNIAKYCTLALH